MDGLTGFGDAIRTVFPQTEVQLCIVHVVRSSLRFVPYKDRKRVAGDLKGIYTAATEAAALGALEELGLTQNYVHNLLSSTTTRSGLTVGAEIDHNTYPKGIKMSDAQIRMLDISRKEFHDEWNYTLHPQSVLPL